MMNHVEQSQRKQKYSNSSPITFYNELQGLAGVAILRHFRFPYRFAVTNALATAFCRG
ncbi:hypothetical protein RchiOBHm_Chr2g0154051 [Rosa chinensis]|uniref:Uncharacterized protein n=1 Tax=Rosa chinensis TaxID=74649 RepID=A0A2P6S0W5_ROSCH|nr:hypothetical protein RchiOBHm_Chr2g0154051 [Rosa chinensis]